MHSYCFFFCDLKLKVSVFDSVVQGGDSVWEGLRIYNGKVFKLEEHLDRMFDSAKALAFNNVPTRDEVRYLIYLVHGKVKFLLNC